MQEIMKTLFVAMVGMLFVKMLLEKPMEKLMEKLGQKLMESKKIFENRLGKGMDTLIETVVEKLAQKVAEKHMQKDAEPVESQEITVKSALQDMKMRRGGPRERALVAAWTPGRPAP